MRTLVRAALLLVAALPAAARAQSPATPPPAAPPPASVVAPAPAAAGDFVYEPNGRRDPFVDPLGNVGEPQAIQRGEGAAGLTLSEISISGVIQSRGLLIAMVQGPDQKTYVIHAGDKLADGTVSSVNSQGITVLQDMSDRLSPRRQREVKKLLRSFEGVK
jgi:type IV pilus assembly protein PilP